MIENRIHTYTIYELYVFIYVQYIFLVVPVNQIEYNYLYCELLFCNTTSYISNGVLIKLSNEFYQTT